jgi:hypothetical protein
VNSTFMGMAGYTSASVFDLLEDCTEDSSSDVGDSDEVLAHCGCFMVDINHENSRGAPPEPHAGTPDGAVVAPANVPCQIVQPTVAQQMAHRIEKAQRLSARRPELDAEHARIEREEAELGIEASTGGMHVLLHGGDPLLVFARATQNIAVAAVMLRSIPESNDPELRRLHRNARGLIEYAAIQQAESSAARARGLTCSAPSRHEEQGGQGPVSQATCTEPAVTYQRPPCQPGGTPWS